MLYTVLPFQSVSRLTFKFKAGTGFPGKGERAVARDILFVATGYLVRRQPV